MVVRDVQQRQGIQLVRGFQRGDFILGEFEDLERAEPFQLCEFLDAVLRNIKDPELAQLVDATARNQRVARGAQYLQLGKDLQTFQGSEAVVVKPEHLQTLEAL